MGMFSDLFNLLFYESTEEGKSFGSTIRKAGKITQELGNYSSGGKGQATYVYEGYGLRIYMTFCGSNEYGGVINGSIYYNGDTVLSYNILNDKFVRGTWEELLDELYQSIDAISNTRNSSDKCKARERRILDDLHSLSDGTHHMGDRVRATVNREYGLDWMDCRELKSIDCSVYSNGSLVFRSEGNGVRTFKPGSWEKVVSLYAQEEAKRKMYRRKEQGEIQARESIKQLKKQREDYFDFLNFD